MFVDKHEYVFLYFCVCVVCAHATVQGMLDVW